MSPPEVWGPAVWRLFHTLADHIQDNAYKYISPHLFNLIVKICKFLPCPECSADSSRFLAKINISSLKTKLEFKNTLYIFHNWVNVKKRKPLFNYSNINVYGSYPLIPVINNFIEKYKTKGNMNLLADSFQRILIIKDLKFFIKRTIHAFLPLPLIQPIIKETNIEETNMEESIEETNMEESIEETNIEESVEETNMEESIEETNIEESVEETNMEESIEETNIEESVEEELERNVEEINLVKNINTQDLPITEVVTTPSGKKKKGRKPKK
jgi:hypothetical protein